MIWEACGCTQQGATAQEGSQAVKISKPQASPFWKLDHEGLDILAFEGGLNLG
jgi:hypothetical protein